VRPLDWQSVLDRLDGAYAPNTLIAYRSDYSDFAVWCSGQGLEAFPTSTPALYAYLEHLPDKLKPTTIRRRIVAIGRLHILAGLPDPADDIGIVVALRRRYRRHGRFPIQAYGLTRKHLERLLDVCSPDLRGQRDRAMLLVGFEALCRRSELVRLCVEDLGQSLRGTPTIRICESKNGPFIRERYAGVSRHTMAAVERWLDASAITRGPMFRPVYKGTVIGRQVCSFTLVRVLKELAVRANLSSEVIEQISGHSLRVGAAQQLALNGYDTAQIMRAGGWKSVTSLSRYIEGAAVDLWGSDDDV